jgi:hypothetical protein
MNRFSYAVAVTFAKSKVAETGAVVCMLSLIRLSLRGFVYSKLLPLTPRLLGVFSGNTRRAYYGENRWNSGNPR